MIALCAAAAKAVYNVDLMHFVQLRQHILAKFLIWPARRNDEFVH